jgi:hypothetical protein
MKLPPWLLPGLACAACVLAGCATVHPGIADPARTGPFFTPHNHVGAPRIPAAVRRVVLLPVHGGEFAPVEMSESLDPVFAAALEKQMRFEVVTLPRDECQKSFGVPDISSASALPHDFLRIVGEKYGAQAVLFVDVTAYRAYRPLTLGVRAKLANVSDRTLLWTFDEIFSTTDPLVVNSVRRFYSPDEFGAVPFDLSTDALRSPGRFAGYVADAVFKTLPPR